MPDQGLDLAVTTVEQAVRDVLDEVAAEFTRHVEQATRPGDLTAATFHVRTIAGMWSGRVRRLLTPLLAAAERAARRAAELADAPLPQGWDDLPGRGDRDPRTLPRPVQEWLRETTGRLNAVGDRLAQAARDTLTRGLEAGDGPEALQARLLARFDADHDGQLSPGRAARIARTEATAAWHAASLAATQELPAAQRPTAKRWIATRDRATRTAHRQAHGQTVPLDDTFSVGGAAMATPADPSAPPHLTVNCRCRLEYLQTEDAARVASYETEVTVVDEPTKPPASAGTGTAADGGPHTTGMVALVPTRADAHRLAVDGGLSAEDLHLTLLDLGPADAYTPQARQAITEALRSAVVPVASPGVHARLFGAAHWNPTTSPAWVWSATDAPADARARDVTGLPVSLPEMRQQAVQNVQDVLDGHHHDVEQYSPWQPHVTASYSQDPTLLSHLTDRLGDVTFDRLRVSFAGEAVDIPLVPEPTQQPEPEHDDEPGVDSAAMVRTWSTPDSTALAFEDLETGDGRIFASGALYWTGGPWPLQYAEAMLSGHDGAELAGSIQHITRDHGRITGTGVLYPARDAGAEAIELLDAGAPLGVSVDLDDVSVEFVDRRGDEDSPGTEAEPAPGGDVVATTHLTHASLLPLPDGAWAVRATRTSRLSAANGHNSLTNHVVEWTTGPDGTTPWDVIARPLGLPHDRATAAAGDPDRPDLGTVVHTEATGDVLMRITRGRVRGATLVAVPAYDQARIVLDPTPTVVPRQERQEDMDLAAAAEGEVMRRVVAHVTTAPAPVTARQVARALGIPIVQARDHLVRAAAAGRIVRLSPGLYTATATLAERGELSAAMSGDTDLPIHPDREREWDGDAAASRVLDWATGEDGTVDANRLGQAFLYRDADANPATLAAYKLGMADVFGTGTDAELHIVPRAVFTIAGVLEGSRGGVDLPDEDREEIRDRVEGLYDRIADTLDDPTIRPPWDDDEETAAMRDIEASAWTALRETKPMRADWFAEPTPEELPPGSGGVHYVDGRVYGWVAQAGEPHAGHPGKNLTIESLGDVDLSHFLRARFTLDNGAVVRAGALTMNVPHSRDGAECDTAACQFDDTRTVAAVITVGLNSRGMWFSGAGAPWLSDWDRTVFQACQPSYHMRQGRNGRWQLRAVLSVPVPGHSSPLTLAASAHQAASAVVYRSNVALAASAYRPALAASAREPAVLAASDHDQAPARPAAAASCACGHGTTPPPPQTHATPAQPVDVEHVAATLASELASNTTFVDSLTTAIARREEENRARVEQLRARVQRTAPEPSSAADAPVAA